MTYLGDFTLSGSVDYYFTTITTAGVASALSGGSVVVYRNNDSVETTSGITLTASFDSRTGLNHVGIDLSQGTVYTAGANFSAVLAVGTVNSVSLAGYRLCSWSIQNRHHNPTAGTITVAGSVTSPITVYGGTVALATAAGTVNNAILVRGGTVDVAGTVTNPILIRGGTVGVVTTAVPIDWALVSNQDAQVDLSNTVVDSVDVTGTVSNPIRVYAGTVDVAGTVTNAHATMATLANQAKLQDFIEFQRGAHTVTGATFYVDGISGNDTTGTGSRTAPYKTISKALTVCTSNAHDCIILLPNAAGGPTTITEASTINVTKNYVQIRGPGRDLRVTLSGAGTVFNITASGVQLSGMRISTNSGASSDGINVNSSADFVSISKCWIDSAHRDAIQFNVANNCFVEDCHISSPSRDGVRVSSGAGSGERNRILRSSIRNCGGSGVNLQGSDASYARVQGNTIRDCTTAGIEISSGVLNTTVSDNRLANNTTNLSNAGTNTYAQFNVLYTDNTTGRVDIGYAAGIAWNSGAITANSLAASATDAIWAEDIDGVIANHPGETTIAGYYLDAIVTDTAEIGTAGAGLTEAGGTGDQLTAITSLLPDDIAEAVIKKNVAYAAFTFMMYDTNGDPATGLTVTAQRSLDGAAFAACANAVAEIGNGWYKINLAAADLNADNVALKFTANGADPTNISILPES